MARNSFLADRFSGGLSPTPGWVTLCIETQRNNQGRKVENEESRKSLASLIRRCRCRAEGEAAATDRSPDAGCTLEARGLRVVAANVTRELRVAAFAVAGQDRRSRNRPNPVPSKREGTHGHSGRVNATPSDLTPLLYLAAMIWSGALPFSTQSIIERTMSCCLSKTTGCPPPPRTSCRCPGPPKLFGPVPPPQWLIPGTGERQHERGRVSELRETAPKIHASTHW